LLIYDAIVKVVVVSLVSIVDVSGGFGSFVYELAIPFLGGLLGKGFSREHEARADQFGFRLAARACYEPKKSINLFNNMQRYTEKLGSQSLGHRVALATDLQFLSSHPLTEERFEATLEALPDAEDTFKHH